MLLDGLRAASEIQLGVVGREAPYFFDFDNQREGVLAYFLV